MSLNPVLRLLTFALLPLCLHAQVEVSGSLAVPTFTRTSEGVVTLSCPTPGAVIRYSIDGTDPGPKTGPYLAPIAMPGGGVVKARAFTVDRKQMSELMEARIEPYRAHRRRRPRSCPARRTATGRSMIGRSGTRR